MNNMSPKEFREHLGEDNQRHGQDTSFKQVLERLICIFRTSPPSAGLFHSKLMSSLQPREKKKQPVKLNFQFLRQISQGENTALYIAQECLPAEKCNLRLNVAQCTLLDVRGVRGARVASPVPTTPTMINIANSRSAEIRGLQMTLIELHGAK